MIYTINIFDPLSPEKTQTHKHKPEMETTYYLMFKYTAAELSWYRSTLQLTSTYG